MTEYDMQQITEMLQQMSAQTAQTQGANQQMLALIQQMSTELRETKAELQKTNDSLQETNTKLQKTDAKLRETDAKLRETNAELKDIKLNQQVINLTLQEYNMNKTPEEMIDSTKRMIEKAIKGDVETAVILKDFDNDKWFTVDENNDRCYLDIENDSSPVANTLYNGKKQTLNNEDSSVDLGDSDILQKKNRSIAIRPMTTDKCGICGAVLISKNGDIKLDDEQLIDHISHNFGGALEKQKMNADTQKAIHDQLTQLPNRHGITNYLQTAALPAMKEGKPVSFLYMDIDNFKQFNTVYGHNGGDAVLKQVADVVQKHCRKDADCGYRDGGEEIGAMFIGVDETQARVIAERVRNEIASTPFDLGNGRTANVTVSVGTAQFTESEIETLSKTNAYQTFYNGPKKRADENVDASKSKGKNCVTSSKEATIEYNKLQRDTNGNRYSMVTDISIKDQPSDYTLNK